MSLAESDLAFSTPEVLSGVASPYVINETLEFAREYCHKPGVTYLMSDALDEWTEIIEKWNPTLPSNFAFNRVRRLHLPAGRRAYVRPHRDHPDFQGEIDIWQLAGHTRGTIEGLGAVVLNPGDNLRLACWPIGQDYPGGRPAQGDIVRNDPRTLHQLRYEGQRDALAFAYDANPGNYKGKFT